MNFGVRNKNLSPKTKLEPKETFVLENVVQNKTQTPRVVLLYIVYIYYNGIILVFDVFFSDNHQIFFSMCLSVTDSQRP